MRHSIVMGLTAVLLVGCASSTRLAKPIESQGKVLTGIDTALGPSTSSYTKASRLNLIMLALDQTANSSQAKAFARVAKTPNISTDVKSVSSFLICNPLRATAVRQLDQKALSSLGSTLSKTAKASPDSLIGLLADFDKSYEVKYAINNKGTDKYSAAMKIQCSQVVGEAFSSTISTDPDLIELNAINGKAFSEGVPDGATPQAGLDQLTKLFTAFTGIAKGALSIRDQAKRNEAIKKFYSNEDNMSKVESSIASIDQAIRSTELGIRLQSKEEFRTAWLEFQKALSLSGNANRYGDNKKLSLAVESLFSAADKIDKVILARTTEHLATKGRIKTIYSNSMNDEKIAEEYFTLKDKIDANTFSGQTAEADKQKVTVRLNEIEVLLITDLDKYQTAYSAYKTDVDNISTSSRTTDSNDICKRVVDSSSKSQPCLLSNSGRALSNSNKKMQYVVLKKWDKMSKEEKSAYWQSVFASVTALNSLNNEIAKFENDKDNFVLLNNILDDLP